MSTASSLSPHAARRWSRQAWIALALLVFGCSASLLWLTHPYFEPITDSSRYILLARSLLAGEGLTYLGQPFTAQMPGFPILLVPVLAVFGTDFHALHLYGGIFGVVATALCFVYWRPRLGVAVALALAIFLWMSPGFQWLSKQVLSDVPGLALLLGCLILERWARRDPFPRRDALVGLAIAAACYVRNANALVVPAIVLARAIAYRSRGAEKRWSRFVTRRAALVVLLPALALLPWKLRNNQYRSEEPTVAMRNYTHWTAVFHSDKGDPNSPRLPASEILKRVPGQLERIVDAFGSRLDFPLGWPRSLYEGVGPGRAVVGAIPLVCLLVVLFRRCEVGEIFAVATLGLLLVYHTFGGRHALAVYVLAIGTVPEIALAMARSERGRRAVRAVAVVLILLLAVVDFDPAGHRAEAAEIHREYQRASDLLARVTSADATLAAHIGDGFSVFLERRVVHLRHAAVRGGLEGALRLLDESDVRGVVVEPHAYRRLSLELLRRHGHAHCITVSERWTRRRFRKLERGPLWLISLERSVAGEGPPCDPALVGLSPKILTPI